jgi:uncharacterized protein (TIGR00369 family)
MARTVLHHGSNHEACGFRDHVGYRIVEWDDGHVIMTLELHPRLLDREGNLQCGLLASMIDSACGLAGCCCTTPGRTRRALTLSLTVNFTGMASSGVIRVVGRKRAGGNKIYASSAEVTDAGGKIIAIGEGTYRYIRGSENPQGVPA